MTSDEEVADSGERKEQGNPHPKEKEDNSSNSTGYHNPMATALARRGERLRRGLIHGSRGR